MDFLKRNPTSGSAEEKIASLHKLRNETSALINLARDLDRIAEATDDPEQRRKLKKSVHDLLLHTQGIMDSSITALE